ncbi:MAG: hypothetical protein GY711_33860 [bacterium]|nr:hypothetical protein [bacterium]
MDDLDRHDRVRPRVCLLGLALLLSSACQSTADEVEPDHLGGCILRVPRGSVPADPHHVTDVRSGGGTTRSHISSEPYVPTAGTDFTVYEFFVSRSFRGTGIAQQAAQLGIEPHRGSREVVSYPNARRNIAFWRKTLPACATGDVRETEEEHAFGSKAVFRFDNG